MLLEILSSTSASSAGMSSFIFFIAIVKFKLPWIMLFIICPFNSHVQFLNHIISIVDNRKIWIWKYWIFAFPNKSRLFQIELCVQYLLLFVSLWWILVAEWVLKAPSVGYVHCISLRWVCRSSTSCSGCYVWLDHWGYHQASLMVATKLALILRYYLIGNGISISLWKQTSTHSLCSILIYYSLKVIIPTILSFHLS